MPTNSDYVVIFRTDFPQKVQTASFLACDQVAYMSVEGHLREDVANKVCVCVWM